MRSLVQRISRRVRPPATEAGERLYAVGDIHGRRDLLDQLIERIDDDDAARGKSRTRLIFLGDLVDRGPESCGVVDRLLNLSRERADVRFIAGNHEQVFLRAAGGDAQATRMLVRIGGRPTLFSYGVTEEEYADLDYPALAERFAERVPPEHVSFLSAFEDWIASGDYLFVHAGVRPGVPLDQQKAEDLRWIRNDFLRSRANHGKMVVHGHTVTADVDIRPNRIGIDTGAYDSGRLTAVGLEGTERWFLST